MILTIITPVTTPTPYVPNTVTFIEFGHKYKRRKSESRFCAITVITRNRVNNRDDNNTAT